MTNRQPGTVLDGKYEILRRLAGGGMGEVYLVRHLHLDERRVIKVLRPEDALDPQAQARFLRAARTATQIKHPNVAILYDYSSLPDGSFYMVWEYVDGEDVGRWLEQHGPFPLDASLDLGVQALRGLESIHSHGVIHRDISPDNLMLTRDVRGRVRLKIIDLGLAKNLHPDKAELDVTQAGMFMGKLRYCSPEQAGMVEGAVLDRRTDLYSFAAVFYEMICGKPPFDSETPHGFVFKRLTEDPLPLVGRVPTIQVPVELDRVIRRGLERDREKRYGTAVEFIEAVERVKRLLLQVSTQEMPRPSLPDSGKLARPAPAVEAPAQRTSSQLSREERDELMAQINRAAERVGQTRELLEQADRALAAGRIDEARRLVAQIEGIDPRAKGLADLRSRLTALTRQEAEDTRVRDAESILERYLAERQLAGARLALETLVEVSPQHPARRDFERRLRELAEAVEKEQKAGKALATAREALAKGDFKAAQRGLVALKRTDPSGELAAAFEAELAEAQKREEREAQLADSKRRFEDLLGRGRLKEAAGELAELADLEVTKVTLDLYQGQLRDAQRVASQEEQARAFEGRFAERTAAGDWLGAREVALEMERELADHPRLPALFAEAERVRGERERRQALEQGVKQVEELIAQGRADQAAVALRILTKMDPNHPKRKQLEKKVAALGA